MHVPLCAYGVHVCLGRCACRCTSVYVVGRMRTSLQALQRSVVALWQSTSKTSNKMPKCLLACNVKTYVHAYVFWRQYRVSAALYDGEAASWGLAGHVNVTTETSNLTISKCEWGMKVAGHVFVRPCSLRTMLWCRTNDHRPRACSNF